MFEDCLSKRDSLITVERRQLKWFHYLYILQSYHLAILIPKKVRKI